MRPVILESPFKGDEETHKEYLKRCVLDCLAKEESPYASHGFFTHFLDDSIAEERQLGIDAGLVWSRAADKVVVYIDYGISSGMRYGIDYHKERGNEIEERRIGKNNS